MEGLSVVPITLLFCMFEIKRNKLLQSMIGDGMGGQKSAAQEHRW